MQRGFRSTETNAVNKSPFPCSFETGGAAGIVANTITMTIELAISPCQRFIPPPINGSATVEFVFLLRRLPHLRLRGPHREHQALRSLQTFRCSPRCEFQSRGTHSCEESERN